MKLTNKLRHTSISIRRLLCVGVSVTTALGLLAAPLAAQELSPIATQARWFQVDVNKVTSANLPDHEALIADAAELGYNGVLVRGGLPSYKRYLRDLVAAADRAELDVVATLGSLGRCQGLIDGLNEDNNLVAAHRSRTKMKLERGRLVVDDSTAIVGDTSSLTLIPNDDDNNSAMLSFTGLTRDTQYRLSFAYETLNNVGTVSPQIVMSVFGRGQTLRDTRIGTFNSAEPVENIGGADLRPGAISFNSRSFTEVTIDVRAEGSGYSSLKTVLVAGNDQEISLEAVPTLNMINTAGLFANQSQNTTAEVEIFQDGNLVQRVPNDPDKFFVSAGGNGIPLKGDPVLSGREPFEPISVTHEPVQVVVPRGSPIWANNRARDYYLTVYHALPHATGGQNSVACNWNHPEVVGLPGVPGLFGQAAAQITDGPELASVDGILLAVDEVRDGGYEADANADFSSALANSVSRIAEDVQRSSMQDLRIYAWSDMFDSSFHGRDCFNLVAGSLAITPGFNSAEDITLVNWDESMNVSFEHGPPEGTACAQVLPRNRDPIASCTSGFNPEPGFKTTYLRDRNQSLNAVKPLANTQIIAAYYEAGVDPGRPGRSRASVEKDHCFWENAWSADGVNSRAPIGGAIYTTWYNSIENYQERNGCDLDGTDGLRGRLCPHQNLEEFATQWWGQMRLVMTSNGADAGTFWAIYVDDTGAERRMWMGREGNMTHPVVGCRELLEGVLGNPTPPVVPFSSIRDRVPDDHTGINDTTCGPLTSLRGFD